MQRERIIATVVAVYAAIVVTDIFSPAVFDFFQGKNLLMNQVWIKADVSPFYIKAVMLIGIVAIIVARGGLTGGKGKALLSPLEIISYSFLTSALVASQLLSYLPTDTAVNILKQSKFLTMVADFRSIWLLAPLVLMVIFGSRSRRASSDD